MSVHRASRRRLAALGALVVASMFAVSLVALRYALSGHVNYMNLIWNLVLAWVPLVFALIAYDRHRRGVSGFQLLVPLVLWLLFLPNAPYLVTDLKILREVRNMPIWFDIGLVTSFAWVGLLLGFISVYLVQDIARRVAGPVVGWATVVGAFGLSGIGIYLGRYLRLNSWDVFIRPSGILHEVAAQLATPRLVGMSLLMAAFLTMAYAMLYTVLEAAVDDRRERS